MTDLTDVEIEEMLGDIQEMMDEDLVRAVVDAAMAVAKEPDRPELQGSLEKMRAHLLTALEEARAERDRLQKDLLKHACYCGPTDPNPEEHGKDCPYRRALNPDKEGEDDD